MRRAATLALWVVLLSATLSLAAMRLGRLSGKLDITQPIRSPAFGGSNIRSGQGVSFYEFYSPL